MQTCSKTKIMGQRQMVTQTDANPPKRKAPPGKALFGYFLINGSMS